MPQGARTGIEPTYLNSVSSAIEADCMFGGSVVIQTR